MAKMTALERLSKRGIVAWEVDGVLARLTQQQSERGDAEKAVIKALVDQGAILAGAIRTRVETKGDLGGQRFPGYKRGGKVAMSETYAAAANADPGPWTWGPPDESRWRIVRGKDLRPTRIMSIRVFTSSADFHARANTKPGSYSVSGGMWKGIQARGSGASSVIIDFAGSSEGSGKSQRFPSYRGRSDRSVGSRSTNVIGYFSERARNGWKAGAIFDRHRVHVLMPTDGEIDEVASEIGNAAGRYVSLILGG